MVKLHKIECIASAIDYDRVNLGHLIRTKCAFLIGPVEDFTKQMAIKGWWTGSVCVLHQPQSNQKYFSFTENLVLTQCLPE